MVKQVITSIAPFHQGTEHPRCMSPDLDTNVVNNRLVLEIGKPVVSYYCSLYAPMHSYSINAKNGFNKLQII
jgi:hypothetical protein